MVDKTRAGWRDAPVTRPSRCPAACCRTACCSRNWCAAWKRSDLRSACRTHRCHANDGGLALGQAAIAAARHRLGASEDELMCLGIPGRIVAISDTSSKLAIVDVGGVRRPKSTSAASSTNGASRSLYRRMGAGPCRFRNEPHRRGQRRRARWHCCTELGEAQAGDRRHASLRPCLRE